MNNNKEKNIRRIQFWDKKNLLLVIAIICLILYFYGPKSIPFAEHLPTIVGLFSLINLLVNKIAAAENN